MFRQDEVFIGGWREKTIEAMQRRRFDTMVERLAPLGSQRLEALSAQALRRRIEHCWQEVERRPMRSLQMAQIRRCVLESIQLHADCLSREEHNLVERALILGGTARIEDAQELEAAQALSLRLWASVGLVSGKPYIELEQAVMQPAARAIASERHERIRQRFEIFHAKLARMLYCVGAVDDRLPQQMILRDVMRENTPGESASVLARRYLWSSCDCVDYGAGVMLLHPALAEPLAIMSCARRRSVQREAGGIGEWSDHDILPEEIPLQDALERAIDGAMRDGYQARDTARSIRYLCKQGAPLEAMADVLQSSLIVMVNAPMRGALEKMYYLTPKWIDTANLSALQ